MTNDVGKIRSAIVDDKDSLSITRMTLDDIRNSVKRKYYFGKIDEAYADLNLFTFNWLDEIHVEAPYYLHNKVEDLLVDINTPMGKKPTPCEDLDKGLAEAYKEVLDAVSPIYDAIGKAIPEKLQNLTYNQLLEFGTKPKDAETTEKND